LGSTAQRTTGESDGARANGQTAPTDDGAFTAAVAEHHRELARFAFRLCGDRTAAEDIVAEAYARVLPHWRAGRVDGLLPYLMRTVANEAYARHRRWRLERTKEPPWAPSDQGRFEDQVESHDELWSALERLPLEQRMVLVLRIVEDLSEEQTAEVLGIRPGTVKSRLSRALGSLRLVLAAAAVAVAVAVVVIVARDDEGDDVRMTDPPVERTTTTDDEDEDGASGSSSTTSTSPRSSTTTSTPFPGGEAGLGGSGIDVMTVQSPTGFGPIEAGMSVEEANAASGVTISVGSASGGCVEGTVPGAEGILLAIDPAGPGGGTIRSASGSVMPTAEGVQIGQYRDELIATLGPPTRAEETSLGQMLIYERDGGGYGVQVVGDMVLGLASGDPDWYFEAQGCP
jgi:RNA polymerase sigma-70 factor (sigma-E family)